MTTSEILATAKRIKGTAALMSTEQKNSALINIAAAIESDCDNILRANSLDLANMRSTMPDIMLNKLTLTAQKICDIVNKIRAVAKLPDPIGAVLEEFTRPNGLNFKKVCVPLGVVATIYENDPLITVEAAALCIKSGNVCVLRIGKEAYGSARAIVAAIKKGLKRSGVSLNLVNLVEDSDRASIEELITAVGQVDLLIPRGSASLVNSCVENARVPCLQTAEGICHIYVDEYADFDKALNIIENSKCVCPSDSSAVEVLLVNKNISEKFLPLLYERLVENRTENPVELLLDDAAFAVLGDRKNCLKAVESDFDTEFSDYKMAVKIINGVKEAAAHISVHSTGYSECIVTEDSERAKIFARAVDSAAVYINASTRFIAGDEFGFGCEMGVSTQKFHARGPIGLRELTSYKYVVSGDGQVR